MATLDLTAEVDEARKLLRNYQKRKVPTAARRSVNTALRGGRTDTVKGLKTRITMTSGNIRKRVQLALAPGGTAQVRGELKVIGPRKTKEFSNLGSFKIQKAKKSVSGKRRLSAAGLGAKVYGEKKFKKYRGAFAWRRPGISGESITVFKRVKGAPKVKPTKRAGKGDIRRYKRGPKKGQTILRQPIKPVYGASLKREFVRINRRGQKAVIDLVRVSMRTRFIKEFNRQLTLL